MLALIPRYNTRLSSSSPSYSRFYRPGTWALSALEKFGLARPLHPAILFPGPISAIPAGIWLEHGVTVWSVSSFVGASSLGLLTVYLAGAEAVTIGDAEAELKARLHRVNNGMAGLTAELASIVRSRQRQGEGFRASPTKVREQLRALQVQLLAHVVDVVRLELKLDAADPSLSANWCARRTGSDRPDGFQAVLYDRPMQDRRPDPSTWKIIKDGRPGASASFHSKKVVLTDVTVARKADPSAFPVDARYQAILTIPVMRGRHVIGVVNLDDEQVGRLEQHHASLVVDVVYLIGLIDDIRELEAA